jgi:predicted HicB family RNase H-like nuclease
VPSTAADKGGADAMIEDKGGFGAVEFDADAELIHGEVVKARDGVTFQGHSVAEVQLALHESGDDDREFCRRRSESPAKTRPGPFVSRISPALHRPAHIAPTLAVKRHNVWVTEKLQGALQRNTAVTSPHHAQPSRSQAPPAEAQGPCMTGGSPGAARE